MTGRSIFRLIGGTVAGLVAWFAVVTVLNLGLRHSWPAYAAVEKAMTFTLSMMLARLGESALSSLASGAVAALVARDRKAALFSGLVLLAMFLPVHYSLWHKFPVWYHLTFLVSLVVLSAFGALFSKQRKLPA
jgi:hypothetical protein